MSNEVFERKMQMDSLKMRELKAGKGIRKIILSGQMTNDTVSGLENKMNDLFDSGVKHLILDLKQLEYICSKGVALLFHYTSQGEERGRRIGILAPPEKVKTVFDMCGGESAFNMADTDEALAERTGIGKSIE